MKAIYKRDDLLCVIIEDNGQMVLLEPIDGDEHSRFWVNFGDPNLIIDPTDGELLDAGGLYD